MHLCIWLVHSVFENALSASIVGLMYGPIFPSVLALAADLLPQSVHMITMAVLCVSTLAKLLLASLIPCSSCSYLRCGFANLGACTFAVARDCRVIADDPNLQRYSHSLQASSRTYAARKWSHTSPSVRRVRSFCSGSSFLRRCGRSKTAIMVVRGWAQHTMQTREGMMNFTLLV